MQSSYETRIKRYNIFMRIGSTLQLLFGLFGLSYCISDMVLDGTLELHSIQFADSNANSGKISFEEYCVLLVFNSAFVLVSILGFLGYCYEKGMAILLHTILTFLGSICALLYYVLRLYYETSDHISYVFVPIYGVLFGGVGFWYLHAKHFEVDEDSELPLLEALNPS